MGVLLQSTEEVFLPHRDGLLDEECWMTRAGVMLAALRSDLALTVYVRTRESGFYSGDFVVWADKALADRYGK